MTPRKWYETDTKTQNLEGNWVPAIPLPLNGLRKKCPWPGCHTYWFTTQGYRGHYALAHILKLPDSTRKNRQKHAP